MRTFILSLALLLSASAWSAPFVAPPLSPLKAKTPLLVTADVPFLYHWTSIDSLRRLAEGANPRVFPFKKIIDPSSFIARSFPALSGRPGLFAWNNPVGGMGASPQEMYATEKDPAVIRLQMKPNLRILVLESVDGGPPEKRVSFEGVDVIFHSRKFSFHEFIILNPGAIAGFTADPRLLQPEFQQWIPFFQKLPSQGPDKEEPFYVTGDLYDEFGKLSPSFDRLILPRIRLFLQSLRAIPAEFVGAH